MPTDRAGSQDPRLAGRYQLGRVLGSGGSGVVHEGEDTLLRRQVAIKQILLPPHASQAERDVIGERVLREARAAARLRHTGLVTVYDVIDADGHTWIVMEYVDGTSLSDLVRESGRLSPLRVARIGISLAYALEAAHRAGVVHRDVKPGNVLVSSDGQARLTDFGIAVTEGDPTLTGTGMLVGSPAYISPERARGAKAGPASDVWGLGATLFTAVEGDPPFTGDGPLATLTAVVEDRRRPFRHAGVLRGVLVDLLNSDPARRPSLAEARGRLRKIAESLEAGTSGRRAQRSVPDRTPATTAVDTAPVSDGGRADGESLSQAAVGVPPPRLTEPVRGPEAGLDVLTGEGPVPPHGRGAQSDGDGGGRDDLDLHGKGRRHGNGTVSAKDRRARRSRAALIATSAVALLAAVAVTLGLVLTDGSDPSPASAGPIATSSATTPSGSTPTNPSGRSTGEPSTGRATGPPETAAAAPPAAEPSEENLGALVPSATDPAAAPEGFTSHSDASGWSAAVPANWTVAQRGNGQTFTAPSGYPNLLIEAQAKAGPSAIDAWYSLEPSVRATSPGYRRVSIRPADGGDGTNAAIWEFTSTSGGQTIHVLDFGVVRNGHGYGLLWRVPEDRWQADLGLMRTIFTTFRPGP